MSQGAPPGVYQQTALLRKYQTPAEEKLWLLLRQKPGGYKFRRQHPLGFFILDFYCHAAKLAIEIDGDVHQLEKVENNDEEREQTIRKMGVDVIRFTNEQVLNEAHKVVKEIVIYIDRRSILSK